jgi:hypothetical protein
MELSLGIQKRPEPEDVMAMPVEGGVARTLWTGGWDSTFRICQLVLQHRVQVQPYYVIEPERRSAPTEIRTMSRIRKSLVALDPAVDRLLADTVFVCKHDLAADKDLARRYENLRSRSYLGPQYEWLARLATQRSLDGLELSVHVDDRAFPFIKECAEHVEAPTGSTYRIPRSRSADDIYLFGHFSFPLLEWSKMDMERYARTHGFLHILNETWFCFIPLNGRPCGVCDPCRFAMTEGMQHRLTSGGRIRYRLRFLLFTAPRGVLRWIRRFSGPGAQGLTGNQPG